MPEPKEEVIYKIKSSLRKKHPTWSDDKVMETAHKIYNSKVKSQETVSKKRKEFLLTKENDIEEFRVFGFIRTTYPDLEGDITPKETLETWADSINGYPDMNNESSKGDLHHNRSDDHLVSIAEYAEVIPFSDGQYGLWVSDFVNAVHPDYTEIRYEIENGMLPAYSVEFDSRNMNGKIVTKDCGLYGYAHANRPVDVHAVKINIKELPNYAQFILKNKEVKTMDENKNVQGQEPGVVVGVQVETKEIDILKKEVADMHLKMKEILGKEKVPDKVLIKGKENDEEDRMEGLPLKFKEIKDACDKRDWLSFKERAKSYVNDNSELFASRITTFGIPLQTTMKMKCVGNRIEIIDGPRLKFKDVLDGDANAGTYTESIVEFADVYQPGIVETFNNEQGLLGEMKKVDVNPGDGGFYGWRMKIGRNASRGFVDADNVIVDTGFMDKQKVRNEIKVARVGVSIADYTLYHSAKNMGDLFQIEVDDAMLDLMATIKTGLYAEQAGGTGVNPTGLEAVADGAGNATLYGFTRSAANRLLPDNAADTYNTISGAVVEANLRSAITAVLTEGSNLGSLRWVCPPDVYSRILNVLDTNIRFNSNQNTASPNLGYNRALGPSYDGIPIIVDPFAASTAGDPLYLVDMNSWIMAMSKPPQLTGLAKVSAGTSAYIETYYCTVYLQPRRIHLLDAITA